MASPLTATLTMFGIQVGFPLAGILTGERMFGRTKRTRKFRYYLGAHRFRFRWLVFIQLLYHKIS